MPQYSSWEAAIKASKSRKALEERQQKEARPINRLFRALEEIEGDAEIIKEDIEAALMDGNTDFGFDESDFDTLIGKIQRAKDIFQEIA